MVNFNWMIRWTETKTSILNKLRDLKSNLKLKKNTKMKTNIRSISIKGLNENKSKFM